VATILIIFLRINRPNIVTDSEIRAQFDNRQIGPKNSLERPCAVRCTCRLSSVSLCRLAHIRLGWLAGWLCLRLAGSSGLPANGRCTLQRTDGGMFSVCVGGPSSLSIVHINRLYVRFRTVMKLADEYL